LAGDEGSAIGTGGGFILGFGGKRQRRAARGDDDDGFSGRGFSGECRRCRDTGMGKAQAKGKLRDFHCG